jgi:hypothetical protein
LEIRISNTARKDQVLLHSRHDEKPLLQTCKEVFRGVLRNFNDLHFGTGTAIYWARADEKEGTKMKNSMAKNGAYIGAGAGLVLFAIFGLLPGSLIGGAMGINLAGWLFGLPLDPGLVSRAIVLVSMLVGVLVAGIVMVTATSTVGWLVGTLVDSAAHKAEKEAEAHK